MYAVFFFHSVLAIVERGTYVWRARAFPCFVLFQEIFVFPYMKRRIKCAHITTYMRWSKRRKFQQQKKTAFNRFYYFVARSFLVLFDEKKKFTNFANFTVCSDFFFVSVDWTLVFILSGQLSFSKCLYCTQFHHWIEFCSI